MGIGLDALKPNFTLMDLVPTLLIFFINQYLNKLIVQNSTFRIIDIITGIAQKALNKHFAITVIFYIF